ncbi:MAG: fumarylacetoacetate hydrolase family protein [Hyphomicrobiaceae bacterium]|nr:MAG: fumarylacetoacetate hydrolase family protein [Hyphomicrobiaceae bacterium]
MKLATFRNGTRDGALVVVSRDLTRAVIAQTAVAGLGTLQQLLDNWQDTNLKVERIYAELNEAVDGRRQAPFDTIDFDEGRCTAPLPRAYQWADGSAYVNHVELVRRARGAEMPATFWTDPLMYQGGSDTFLGPRDDIEIADEAWGIDLEGEVAVITDDVPMGVDASEAGEYVRLVMLVNDVSLRNLIPGELAKGFGFFHGKPSTAFSPVAVTPDELGTHWREGKLHLPLLASINGTLLGKPNAGQDMTFSFPELIAHAAKTRRLGAGTIVGSGTVSNKLDDGPGKPVGLGGAGYTCLAEVRTVETILEGKPNTPFLKFGDRVSIEMLDASGRSIFGKIEQKVVRYSR